MSFKPVVRFAFFILIFSIICLNTADSLSFQNAQRNAVIMGRVLDGTTGEPLPQANVYLSNTLLGSASDSEGNSRIFNVSPGTYTLIASYVGYETEMVLVVIDRTAEYRHDFLLKQKTEQLPELVVTAKRPKDWKKNIKRFEDEFLGSSKNASECTILNAEVLNFETKNKPDVFIAQAGDLLKIENRALGYLLKINLVDFSIKDGYIFYWTEPFLEEFTPENEIEKTKWEENRLKAYKGSLRHFLRALAAGRITEEEFQVKLTDALPPEGKYELAVEPGSLFTDGNYSFEKILVSDGVIRVKYLPDVNKKRIRVQVPGSRGGSYKMVFSEPFSWLVLSNAPAVFNIKGYFNNPYDVTQYGIWADYRVADFLPYEYNPPDK